MVKVFVVFGVGIFLVLNIEMVYFNVKYVFIIDE